MEVPIENVEQLSYRKYVPSLRTRNISKIWGSGKLLVF